MSIRIAIHEDSFTFPQGHQSFSDAWFDLVQGYSNVVASKVSAITPSSIRSLKHYDAFMWRPVRRSEVALAKRVIPAIRRGVGIPTFPSPHVAGLTRDKIAQAYVLEALGLPVPRTQVCYDLDHCLDEIRDSEYPLVIKTPDGRGSEGVALLKNREEAESCVKQLFTNGVNGLWEALGSRERLLWRRWKSAARLAAGRSVCLGREGGEVVLQEFIPNNAFDVRIVVVGRYAFGFRRNNRENDFRASGSGSLVWSDSDIDRDTVSIAFQASRALDAPFLAFDFLRRGAAPLICEINFAYAAWSVKPCESYWFLDDKLQPDQAEFRRGEVHPERWTLEEFLHWEGFDVTRRLD